MDNNSLYGTIIFLICLLPYLIPIVKVLHRTGYSGWWSLLMFIPVVNFFGLYAFSVAKWPKLEDAKP